MPTFWSIVRNSIRQQATYRTALLAGLATNLFFGLLRAAVMIALYAGKTEVNQFSVTQAIQFVGLSQAMIAFLSLFGYQEVMKSVYSGDIAAALIQPVGFFRYWMARDLGRALVNLIGRGVLFMLAFRLFFPVILPDRIEQWVGLILSLTLAWMVSFAWRFLVNLAAFWTTDGVGVARLAFMISQLLCGFVMPLALLPDWFSQFCYWTPFPAMLSLPMDIYLGRLTGIGLVGALATQAVWALVLIGVSQFVLSAGLRKLVIQGG